MKRLYFVFSLCVIALKFTYSCGGGGGGGNAGSAPEISNLWFSPTSVTVGDSGGTVPVTGTFDFVDNNGNVSTLTLTPHPD